MASAVSDVLAGTGSYDELNGDEQKLVRAAWRAQMEERIGALEFAEEFAALGRAWAELGADDVVVVTDAV